MLRPVIHVITCFLAELSKAFEQEKEDAIELGRKGLLLLLLLCFVRFLFVFFSCFFVLTLSLSLSLAFFIRTTTTTVPQHVVFKLEKETDIGKIGIFLHGENNQNPKKIRMELSEDGEVWDSTPVKDIELEHRAGDHLFTVQAKDGAKKQFVKLTVLENFGGSGIYVSKVFVFGKPSAESTN